MTKKRNGFTLVELLVVISIIALLLAILMPTLSKVRTLAKSTICQSNLRQVGIGVTCYTNENKNVMPCSYDPSNLNYLKNNWVSLLVPYLSSGKKAALDTKNYKMVDGGKVSFVWMCPEYKATAGFSYSMNYHLCFGNGAFELGLPRTTPRKTFTIHSPATSILVVDTVPLASGYTNIPEFNNGIMENIIGYFPKSRGVGGLRHGYRANCLMADTHVDWDTHNGSLQYSWLLRFPNIYGVKYNELP